MPQTLTPTSPYPPSRLAYSLVPLDLHAGLAVLRAGSSPLGLARVLLVTVWRRNGLVAGPELEVSGAATRRPRGRGAAAGWHGHVGLPFLAARHDTTDRP
jgi:hypothetical protein